MFSARYGPSTYITQIRFVFKRLNSALDRSGKLQAPAALPPGETASGELLNGLNGAQRRSGRFTYKPLSLFELKPRSCGSLAPSLVSIPTELFRHAKLRKATISFVRSVRPSVCPHGTTRLPLDGFS